MFKFVFIFNLLAAVLICFPGVSVIAGPSATRATGGTIIAGNCAVGACLV